MSETPIAPQTTTRSSRWPYGIACILGLGVLANLWMVKIAVSHPSVPTSSDYWQESLDFDRQLKEQAMAKSLGWRVDVRACTWRQDQCILTLEIVDKANAPVAGLQGHAELWRADSVAFDRRIAFAAEGAGTYTAKIALPNSGNYIAALSLFRDGALWKTQLPLSSHSQQLP